MGERDTESNGVSNLVVAITLFAAVAGAAFWAWRRAAPLSRWYSRRRQRSDDRGQREPNPQRKPGTAPI